ncbi:MAG TPA: DUF6088 family protein [Terriglobia bacterium]|nr:DUF6088 family protein [Terriglobia bacterium]
MDKSIETKAYKRIIGSGRGWAFSPQDFARLGPRSSVDFALHRLHRRGVIRRVIRGIYDFPPSSELLGRQLGPDLDQVAQALARKFGWRIQPSGVAAQNILGLSTQVPSKVVYLSDGPNRRYAIGKTTLEFKHTALKETGFKLRESSIIVHALKSLGQDGITPDVLAKVRSWLSPELRSRVLADTQTATGWVYAALREICRERMPSE